MASALQRQLAQISANSTHQLDLKAQKTQHAKSLLFEPSDASRQSFDDIYHICAEGFDELSQLDSRFNQFANNLFGESSKDIDRGQLTRKENEELDVVIERFLGLVQGRLLLKPAQKSVEWLVRRFRAHEFNTEMLLLTFLPYHTDQRVFPALLAILPTNKELPESFKWLHPYFASLSCPPRHAILSAMASNRTLFASFNSFVLQVAKAGHASGILLGFWAGLTAQAANSMVDSSRTGRDNVRKQREEEILLKILPVLQDAFTISKKGKIDEMFVGSCMIVTILATKASLSDAALDAMMEAVAGAWNERTVNQGISCLAAVAEEKEQTSIPASVARAMLRGDLLASLTHLSTSQRVSKLSGGFALGVLRHACLKDDPTDLQLVEAILTAEIMQDRDIIVVLEALISERQKQPEGMVSVGLSEMTSRLRDSQQGQRILEQSGRRLGLPDLIDLQAEAEPISADQMELEFAAHGAVDRNPTGLTEFQKVLERLPELPTEIYSYLNPDPINTDLFMAYSRAFHSALDSEQFLEAFLNIKSLHRSTLWIRPTLFSFLARLWSSRNASIAAAAKLKALQIARIELERLQSRTASSHNKVESSVDLQALFPYLLTALGDEKNSIRVAAVEMCRAIQREYNASNDSNLETAWAQRSIYNPTNPTGNIRSLTVSQARQFISGTLVPILEECILDPGYVMRHMTEALGGVSSTSAIVTKQSEISGKASRTAVCNFLAPHAAITPVLRSKLHLLQILRDINKDASAAREEVLVPFVREWTALSSQEVQNWCDTEGVEVGEMDTAVLGTLGHRSDEQMKVLRDICSGSVRSGLVEAAFERQRQLWTALKPIQRKLDVVEWLLQMALREVEKSETVHDRALETLRALELSPEVATHMLELLPSISDLDTQPPVTKRQRRTSENERPRAADSAKLDVAVRRMTLVLELLEACEQRSSRLLRPLFHLLAELRQYKNSLGSELVYLHGMLLDILLEVVSAFQTTHTAADELNKDIIRTDLLIDCVRSTSSPQIHNTALLIVSALANLAPESVLHSVIPLFTFMSSTVLRKTDEYSVHVTDQAVTRVVPALAESLKKKGNDLLVGVSELLLSFVAAWEHVPMHRRLALFEMVVRAVGVADCLGVVAAMLVERYANSASSVSTFVADLINRFDTVTILNATNQWLQLVFDGLHTRPRTKHKKAFLSDLLLGFSEKNEEEQEEAVEITLRGLAVLLKNETMRRELASTLATATDNEAASIRSAYATLTEQVIQLTERLETLSNTEAKFAAESLLSATLALLPTSDFIASCAQLMQSGSASTREQVFRSLEARVHSSKPRNAFERQTFLDVLPSCAVFVNAGQPANVRMAAIACIDTICERFGKSDTGSVKNAAESVAGPAALGSEDLQLRVLSLLCLASIAGILGDGDESISIFPSVVFATLHYLTGSEEVDRQVQIDRELQEAGFRLLTAVLDHIPWILASSPQELDRALAIAAKADGQDGGAITEFMALTTKKIPASELFHSIERTWSDETKQFDAAEVNRPIFPSRSVGNLLRILRQAVQHHTKATITKNATSLFSLLLMAFDLRRQSYREKEDMEAMDSELDFASVDELALEMTLKMNDATFRPFFVRLVEWSTTSLPRKDTRGRTERLKSVYSFALLLFEKLKSLVTSYMSFLLDSTGEVLRASGSGATDPELLQLVVKTLRSSFRSDEDDFWTAPAHFEVVAQPLISLLSTDSARAAGAEEAIADLAAAVTASSEQLKAMNSSLLSLLRHESASVRLAAVECQRSITSKVSFDWLALLPEILPAISELQEDDDERVEHQTLLWVREIEEISGESLEGMLA